MYSIKNCLIPAETLSSWEQKFVPVSDVYFFEQENSAIESLGAEVLLLSREQWLGNKEWNTLDVGTALQPWHVSRDAAFVAVMPGPLFDELNQERRMQVFHEQWRLGRGQILELEWLEEEVLSHVTSKEREQALNLLKHNLFATPKGEMVALQHTLWNRLPREVRVQLLLAVARAYVEHASVWPDLSTAEQERIAAINPVIPRYTDTFCSKNGPNCFTTALAGATPHPDQAEWLLSQWMIIEPFERGMKQRGYEKVDKPFALDFIREHDILVWSNAQGTPVHACFTLGNGLVFNTNGQTMFNPWQVLQVSTLLTDWHHVLQAGGNLSLYRQSIEDKKTPHQ